MSKPCSGTPRAPRPGCRERCTNSVPCSTRGRAWRRRQTASRRRTGSGQRPTRGTGPRRTIFQECTLSAAVGPGRYCLPLLRLIAMTPLHIVDPRFFGCEASQDVASIICQALGRGVTRSNQMAMRWTRKAAENGHATACLKLAQHMYHDHPYAARLDLWWRPPGPPCQLGSWRGTTSPRMSWSAWYIGCARGGIIRSMCSTCYVTWRWRGVFIATTKGVRLWAI